MSYFKFSIKFTFINFAHDPFKLKIYAIKMDKMYAKTYCMFHYMQLLSPLPVCILQLEAHIYLNKFFHFYHKLVHILLESHLDNLCDLIRINIQLPKKVPDHTCMPYLL